MLNYLQIFLLSNTVPNEVCADTATCTFVDSCANVEFACVIWVAGRLTNEISSFAGLCVILCPFGLAICTFPYMYMCMDYIPFCLAIMENCLENGQWPVTISSCVLG